MEFGLLRMPAGFIYMLCQIITDWYGTVLTCRHQPATMQSFHASLTEF